MPLELVPETPEQAQDRNAATRGFEWPAPIDLTTLAAHDPRPPAFIIDEWLPCGYATLMAGHGGVGKSGIALGLAMCIAAGLPFHGLNVERRRVLYLSCEDRETVLHWRLKRLCSHLGTDMAHLAGWLDILDLVGHPTILWQKDQTGAALTPAFGALDSRIKDSSSQVLIVDGISDTFGGNENARAEVKAFINSLLGLVPPDDGAVVLVGHVAKASTNGSGDGYSGSTGWHNSVRARWYLYPETTQGDEPKPSRTGALLLELQKSNLGPTDRTLRFVWDANSSLFVGEEVLGESNFDRKQRERVERDGILAALKASPDYVPAASTGNRTAFHVLSAQPNFPTTLRSGNGGKRRFWRHVEEMRANGLIREDEIRRSNRHTTAVLVACDKGCADAPNVDY